MAEHFRDFTDPVTDAPREAILERRHGPAQAARVQAGKIVLGALGAERVAGPSDAMRMRFPNGSWMDMHEPDTVIPALAGHGDMGLFYTLTGRDDHDGPGPLWTPGADYIPPAIDTGNQFDDSLVVLSQDLMQMTRGLRRAKDLKARLTAPRNDARARREWQMSTKRTKEEIAAHYDLTQEIYTGPNGFLDKNVQYSSGLLPPGHKFESLEALQEAKIDSLARKLELDNADTLLEVGGGWGGLAVALAERAPNLHITSLTVSDEQWTRAKQRAEAAGVADRVDFLDEDYRDHLKEGRTYDRVVSVEMIEAVDWRDLGVYFDALTQFADPEHGAIVLQAITNDPKHAAYHRHHPNFANTAIFPGGSLVPEETITAGMAERGWDLHETTALGDSYALTLREWTRNMNTHKATLINRWQEQGISLQAAERFYRGFSIYLAGCQANFLEGNIRNFQLTYSPSARTDRRAA